MKWTRRAEIEQTDLYRRRIWRSAGGRHRISEFLRLWDRSIVYYAECWRPNATGGGWDVISRHRTRQAAVAACERAMTHQPMEVPR